MRQRTIFALSLAASLVSLRADAQTFTDQGAARGLDYTPNQTLAWGDGACFADLDTDGDLDVIAVGRVDGRIGIFENDGTGYFTDRSLSNGLSVYANAVAPSAADYDRDGDLDIYIGRHGPNLLFRNDGNFQFTNVTATAGVGTSERSRGAGWGDFDGDGWLDLAVPATATASGVTQAHNSLYLNNGDGTFTDVADKYDMALPDDEFFQASFFDYDRDGDPDLYFAALRGFCANFPFNRGRLYRNDGGGALTEVSGSSNALACGVDAMCIAIGDFDNNLYQDFYLTNTLPNPSGLLMNQGDGTFTREEFAWDVGSLSQGWGAVMFDYDMDGWLDLYVCNLWWINNGKNRLYKHVGSPPAIDVADAEGVGLSELSYCVSVGDVDNDGDLDMLVSSRNEPLHLFINGGGYPSWAMFDVIGEGPDRWAISSRVDVRTGSEWRTRETILGSNYMSQNDLRLHFGLIDALVMDEVVVTWPNGGPTRTLTNLPTIQEWKLYPPDKLGDADQDGDREMDDFIAFAECFGNDVAPGCEMMDYDGNSVIEMADFTSFLAHSGMVQADCNSNGIGDMEDILLGNVTDSDADGVPDSCGSFAESCFGDGGDQQGCTDCPCGNEAPAGSLGGCLNSAGTSARLVPSGSASIGSADLRFEAEGVTPFNSSVLVSGNSLAPANSSNPCFGLDSGVLSVSYDGLRCAVQGVLRHGVRPSNANGEVGVTTNGWGTPNGFFNFSAFVSGSTKHFQLVHRDDAAAVCMRGQNTSQAVSATFTP